MKVYEDLKGAYIKLSSKVLFKKAGFESGDEFVVRYSPNEIHLVRIVPE